jgi:hypothetical protein
VGCKVDVGLYLFGGVDRVTWHAFWVISYRSTLWDFPWFGKENEWEYVIPKIRDSGLKRERSCGTWEGRMA